MLRYGSFSIIFTAIFWQGKWAGFILGAEERGKNFDTVVSKKKKKKEENKGKMPFLKRRQGGGYRELCVIN